MLRPSARSCRPWDGTIETDQSSTILHRESEQVDVRHLTRPVKVARLHGPVVEEADGAGPELVIFGAGRSAQPFDRLEGRNRAGIAWLTDDADEAVLRQGTGRPAVANLRGDPLPGSLMVDVCRIEQRQEHVDVEQCSHQSSSSSRSLSISSL